MQNWMQRSQQTLEQWFEPWTARALDAFIEGWRCILSPTVSAIARGDFEDGWEGCRVVDKFLDNKTHLCKRVNENNKLD